MQVSVFWVALLVAVGAFMTLWYGLARLTCRYDLVDSAWGPGFVFVAWLSLANDQAPAGRGKRGIERGQIGRGWRLTTRDRLGYGAGVIAQGQQGRERVVGGCRGERVLGEPGGQVGRRAEQFDRRSLVPRVRSTPTLAAG